MFFPPISFNFFLLRLLFCLTPQSLKFLATPRSIMNEYRDDKTCYFHPREEIIGICALCLNERLLVLASQQEQLHQANNSTHRTHRFAYTRNSMNLPKIALSSLLNRLDLRHRKSDDQCDGSLDFQEDSFISMKFEENGAGSWEKSTVLPKMSLEHCNMPLKQSLSKGGDEGVKAVIEHPKPRGSVRWRKRIGDIFQLIRWKKTSKGNAYHVGMRHGWIRSLTKRRSKE